MALKYDTDGAAERFVWGRAFIGMILGGVPFVIVALTSKQPFAENTLAMTVLVCGTILGGFIAAIASLASVLSAAMKKRGTGPGKISKMVLEPDEVMPVIPPPKHPVMKERPEPVQRNRTEPAHPVQVRQPVERAMETPIQPLNSLPQPIPAPVEVAPVVAIQPLMVAVTEPVIIEAAPIPAREPVQELEPIHQLVVAEPVPAMTATIAEVTPSVPEIMVATLGGLTPPAQQGEIITSFPHPVMSAFSPPMMETVKVSQTPPPGRMISDMESPKPNPLAQPRPESLQPISGGGSYQDFD